MAELRPHLRKRIEDADPRVVRVIAPAGFGKTTLVRALIASTGGVLCDLADLAGRPAEATRAFRRYREFLAAEFGAEPSADLARQVAKGAG